MCSDPQNSDTDFEGFAMSKLTKKDKLNIYREWTIEHKGTTYLSKKYGIRSANIEYLVSLIHRHGMKLFIP